MLEFAKVGHFSWRGSKEGDGDVCERTGDLVNSVCSTRATLQTWSVWSAL